MTRMSFGALALALGLCTTPVLHAQRMQQPTEGVRFGLGVGATLPMGNYGDADKMGFNILGVLQIPLASTPVHLRVDGLFSQTAHEVGSGNTSILGGTVSALYHFGDRAASMRPYVLGGLGFYNVDFGGAANSQTKIGFGFGGGILFGLGGFNAFAEARYISVQASGSSLSLVPLSVGLMFGY